MIKRCFVILHSADSTEGTTSEWLNKNKIEQELLIASELNEWPAIEDGDAIVVLGGDMEVWETEKYPWLLKEKDFLEAAIENKRPVFGVCLGSQLLAESLGARVHSNSKWEIGWQPVVLESGDVIKPFHFHSSHFDLPENAVQMASTEFCANQGFKRNGIFVGFQFHTEIDEGRLKKIYAEWDDSKEGCMKTLEETKTESPACMPPLKDFFFDQLDQCLKES